MAVFYLDLPLPINLPFPNRLSRSNQCWIVLFDLGFSGFWNEQLFKALHIMFMLTVKSLFYILLFLFVPFTLERLLICLCALAAPAIML